MSLMAKDYYAIESIMSKIEEELFIQGINFTVSNLDEIRNLLEHILKNRK